MSRVGPCCGDVQTFLVKLQPAWTSQGCAGDSRAVVAGRPWPALGTDVPPSCSIGRRTSRAGRRLCRKLRPYDTAVRRRTCSPEAPEVTLWQLGFSEALKPGWLTASWGHCMTVMWPAFLSNPRAWTLVKFSMSGGKHHSSAARADARMLCGKQKEHSSVKHPAHAVRPGESVSPGSLCSRNWSYQTGLYSQMQTQQKLPKRRKSLCFLESISNSSVFVGCLFPPSPRTPPPIVSLFHFSISFFLFL